MARRAAPLWLAVHEAGHAVARLVLDETLPQPGPMVKEVTVVRDEDRLGLARMDARAPLYLRGHANHIPRAVLDQNIKFDIIEKLAGPIAEVRHRYGSIGPMFDKRPQMDFCLSRSEHVCDHSAARAQAEWLSPSDERALLEQAYDVACALVEREWIGIKAVARVVQAAGSLDGTQFEEAWLGRRQSEQRRDRRDHAYGDTFSRMLSRLLTHSEFVLAGAC